MPTNVEPIMNSRLLPPSGTFEEEKNAMKRPKTLRVLTESATFLMSKQNMTERNADSEADNARGQFPEH